MRSRRPFHRPLPHARSKNLSPPVFCGLRLPHYCLCLLPSLALSRHY